MASLIKNKRTTLERIEKFISPLYFTDVNLYGKLYQASTPLSGLRHFAVPEGARISFDEATKEDNFEENSVGQEFGPTWSTHWFAVDIVIPEEWLGQEVHLRWNAGCEALIWSVDGIPLQGLSDTRSFFILTHNAHSGDMNRKIYIEMACNDLCGAGSPILISPPDLNKKFRLNNAEIAIFDRTVYNLMIDLDLLLEMAKELPETNPRSFDALYAANEMINIIQTKGPSSGYKEALTIAAKFFSCRNGETQHRNVAVGHCHIDCGWLWPYAETVRKCARSWSSVLSLMDQRPDFNFACSQAQQFAWVKESYPKLFEKLKQYVTKGQFIPVGGTWVEMDGNLPSGESFIRQFLYGQKFFLEEFGIKCREFWLPDTFGYSAQLPQIMRMFKIERFLTQKLSWSIVNKFPHHNFIWEGIDGSDVIAHFPPGDSYGMEIRVQELIKQLANLEDKGRVSKSLVLFGYGDGGGGPTEAMLERQKRLQDVDGLPRVELGRPEELFKHLEENRTKLCRWVGELYLELHNATYTTQAAMKSLNRKCEFLLRDVEALRCALLACDGDNKVTPTSESIEAIWKILLLNQFHDVLPGTSISQVHTEARAMLNDVKKRAETMIDDMVCGNCSESDTQDILLLNTLSWEREAIIPVHWDYNTIIRKFGNRIIHLQPFPDESGFLMPIRTNATCLANIVFKNLPQPGPKAFVEQLENGLIEMRNRHLKVLLNEEGGVVSMKLQGANVNLQELVVQGKICNQLMLFDDIPLYWDAWDVMDYHLETRRPALSKLIEKAKITEEGPVRVTVTCSYEIGEKSRVTQDIVLDAIQPYLTINNRIDWGESHKFLKVEFPVSIRSPEATYEIQFGHVKRPTHFNTSWDWARYEVCGHKWMDLSEYGRGVAILNDSKYGHSVRGNLMSLSLLRSSKSPDANADMELHEFSYAIMPHLGGFQEANVVRRAYEFNCPIRQFRGKQVTNVIPEQLASSWFQVSHPAIVLETIKPSEKSSSCYVLRLYESFGGSCKCILRSQWNIRQVALCDGYEETLQDLKWEDGAVTLDFGPYQVLSLLLLVTNKSD